MGKRQLSCKTYIIGPTIPRIIFFFLILMLSGDIFNLVPDNRNVTVNKIFISLILVVSEVGLAIRILDVFLIRTIEYDDNFIYLKDIFNIGTKSIPLEDIISIEPRRSFIYYPVFSTKIMCFISYQDNSKIRKDRFYLQSPNYSMKVPDDFTRAVENKKMKS